MARKMMPQIHKRVISTSIAIIFLFSLLVGFLINQVYVKNYVAMYSSQLVAQVPHIVGELRRDNMLELGQNAPNQGQPIPETKHSDYLAFICEQDGSASWMSSEARNSGMSDICLYVPHSMKEPDMIYYKESPYVVHVISEATYSTSDLFIVVRDVTPQLEKLAHVKRQTWFYVGLAFLAATGLLYAASYWSFSPLRKLAGELNEIAESRRETLASDYPKELEDVTDALNRMITLRKDQTQRYRHAMDDLAHSLKSRLAATNALLDDSSLSREIMSKRIVEQVSQMDDMVQYQLKRALVGQRGLVREKTELRPVIASLSGMFSKIYSDKPVNVTLNLQELTSLPLNKADLTELLGNLLENAFRFCISEVRISSREMLEHCVLTVEDDGLGVAETLRESIFQRGVRADQLNPGTGIGLAVCDEIVESYGGKIRVIESELEGAAFIMTFPKLR
ncbi:GHKL domain-containing protein [Grimontia kaedaensis]|uniref:histidine kinase n=1 Tax=Grimontia kaedaensis TaxID=2872157 RepID=A0ABY4WQ54_9GAMM|nr:ATP-binding protein [Grimontia kaedaensis]USH01317.1 GHKL domain-containing protein [Grimontia kaedaensis]